MMGDPLGKKEFYIILHTKTNFKFTRYARRESSDGDTQSCK